MASSTVTSEPAAGKRRRAGRRQELMWAAIFLSPAIAALIPLAIAIANKVVNRRVEAKRSGDCYTHVSPLWGA